MYTITCEATATIRETWAFDLPEGWETMSEEDREDAISYAAPDGECLGDEILGEEEGREWDLSSIAPHTPEPEAGAMSTSDGLGDGEIDAAVERAQNVLLANPEYAGLTTDVAIKQATADLEHYAQRLPV